VIGIFLCSAGLGYYFGHLSNYNKTYGSMGAVIILMVWFYMVAFLFIVGAELNAELLKLETAHEQPMAASEMRRKIKGAPAA
jgi:membrane protein